MKNTSLLIIILFISVCSPAQHQETFELVEFCNFSWVIEKVSDETIVEKKDSILEITATNGITLWMDQAIKSPVKIKFEAKVIDEQGEFDRVSDLNCFWMANDPENPNDFFARSAWRNGTFGNYYSLSLYYAGYGGNNNSTTRFRKYDGNFTDFKDKKIRPDILKEYTNPENLIKANQWYSIEITVQQNIVKYCINDQVLFNYIDEAPYHQGYFGLRTVKNHICYKNITITPL